MGELRCSEGMVLIRPNGASHPDEPAFCIGKTEVTQEQDNSYWATVLRAGFELLIRLINGRTERETGPAEAPLREEAARRIQGSDVSSVEVRPVVAESKPQAERNMAGPRKPVVSRTWQEARDVCAGLYPGGDLPTNRQWENACGNGEYCTASGNLSHSEAIYEADGPADVGFTLPNPNGVYDMTGNVSEWTRDEDQSGYMFIRGGSWDYYGTQILLADSPAFYLPDRRHYHIGFRCVAPAQDAE